MQVEFNQRHEKFVDAYRTHHPRMYGWLYRRVGDEAGDIAHNAFILLYHKIDEVNNIEPWLYGVIKKLLSEHRRHNRIVHAKPAPPRECSYGDDSVAYVNGYHEMRLIIEEAIEAIPDALLKTVFTMVTLKGRTHADVGERLGLSSRRVKYLNATAVRFVFCRLRRCGILELDDAL